MSDPDVRIPFESIERDRERMAAFWGWENVHFESGTLADYRRSWEGSTVNPEWKQQFYDLVYRLLPQEQGRYAVFGCYAYNSYNLPRETQDLDLALTLSDFDGFLAKVKAAAAPDLNFERKPEGRISVYRHDEKADKVADFVIAEMNASLYASLRQPKGTRRVRVPRFGEAWALSPEAFIVAKFYSASEEHRGARRLQDAHDMVQTIQQKDVQ